MLPVKQDSARHGIHVSVQPPQSETQPYFQDFVSRLSSCFVEKQRMTTTFPPNTKSRWISGLFGEIASIVTRRMGHRTAIQVHFGQFISLLFNKNLKPIIHTVQSIVCEGSVWQPFIRIFSAIYHKLLLSPALFSKC